MSDSAYLEKCCGCDVRTDGYLRCIKTDIIVCYDCSRLEWCQSNKCICKRHFKNECQFCKKGKPIYLEKWVYIADGGPDTMPICEECYDKELE